MYFFYWYKKINEVVILYIFLFWYLRIEIFMICIWNNRLVFVLLLIDIYIYVYVNSYF